MNTANTKGQADALRILGGTADDYDRIVDESTGGLDARWKQWMLERMQAYPAAPTRVLDLASGTGILSFLILDQFPDCQLTGVDLQDDYQAVARARSASRGLSDRTTWIHSAVEDAELPEGTYDLVTTCYVPKYADRPLLAKNLWRWCAPGARLMLHDFAHPKHPGIERYLQKQHNLWLTKVRKTHPHWVGCFENLYDVVKASTWNTDFGPLLEAEGFIDVQLTELNHGTAAVLEARKPQAH